jgi:hypothetical protein
MSSIKNQEKLEEVRKRLYERGNPDLKTRSHKLSDTKEPVPTSWDSKPKTTVPITQPVVETQTPTQQVTDVFSMASKKIKKGYRLKILIAGVLFFILALVVSSVFLIFGNNNISGANITISASGPFTIGGGEELPLQVGITNSNTVPIESATLIIDYPSGTQSSTEAGKELFTERLPLKTIKEGETVNIPIRALVFGEENEEKTINVSIEYRVTGSNATFFKEAEPLRFKISSSPVVIRADSLKKISSGQETTVTVTITSNSPTALSEVLVKAEYPSGFDFTKSDPSPTHSQNTWLIQNLKPEGSETITITGVVVGKETDQYAINFSVGVPNERDTQNLASVFAKTQTQFEIEQPFLDVVMKINNSAEREVAVEPDQQSNISIDFTNTLDDTLYDISVKVELGGNDFSIKNIGPASGDYDSSTDSITWNVSNTPALEQVNPGDTEHVSFVVEPKKGTSQTPQLNIKVSAQARRVSENQVSETLVGTVSGVIKVVSSPEIIGVADHSNSVFVDAGPTPPVVGMATTYTMSLIIANGSNDITDALVTTSLPAYVTWLNQVEGSGQLSYNPTTRGIEWAAGDVGSNGEAHISFQVSLLPRSSQVGTTPTLISEQRIRATDRFTGTIVRDTHPSVNATLLSESGRQDEASGRVRATESN